MLVWRERPTLWVSHYLMIDILYYYSSTIYHCFLDVSHEILEAWSNNFRYANKKEKKKRLADTEEEEEEEEEEETRSIKTPSCASFVSDLSDGDPNNKHLEMLKFMKQAIDLKNAAGKIKYLL